MKIIDLSTWERAEHYHFFRQADYPQYSICANVDITHFLQFTKATGLPFYYAMIFAATTVLNDVEAFKYRIRGDKVVLHDTVHPAFTDMSKGSELFKYVTVNLEKDIFAFAKTAKEYAEKQTSFMVPSEEQRDDLTYITCIPWVSFTGMTHTITLNKDDSVPRLSWGKYFRDGAKTLMPFSVQANHSFVDGLHMGRYYDQLQQYLNEII